MSTPTKVQSIAQLTSRVRAQQSKFAASGDQTGNPKGQMPTEKDPACQGTVSIPTDPDGDNDKKTQMPISHANEDGQKDVLTNLPGQVGSGGSCEVPGQGADSTIDGNKKDEAATSSTVSLEKIANRAVKAANAVRAVLTGLTKPAEAAKAANSSTEGNVPKEKDPAETTPPADKKPVIDGLPKSDNKNTDAKSAADALPSAGTPEFFAKLASTMEAVRAIVEIEGGMKMVEDLVTKAAGIDTARALLDDVTIGYATATKAASDQLQLEQANAAYTAEVENAFAELTKNASAEDQAAMVKLAETLMPAVARLETPIEKYAMMAGADDQAAMEDAGAFEEAPPEGAGLPGGGEGEALPIEQIAQLLAAMVEAGEVDQATAEGILQQLAGGAGGDAAAGGDPMAGGGEPPMDPAAMVGGDAAVAGGDPMAGGELPPEAAAAPEEMAVEEEATEPEKAAAALIASIK